MVRREQPIPSHELTQNQRDLAEFDTKLYGKDAPSSALVPVEQGDIVPVDDDVLFPDVAVGRLFELAQHPERYEEEIIIEAIDNAEVLLQKLELRAKLAKPKALPMITWMLGVFIPEVRKQIAKHAGRKQLAIEAVEQEQTIREAVAPLVDKLKRYITNLHETPDRQETLEVLRFYEQHLEKLETLANDPIFEHHTLVTYTNSYSGLAKAIQDIGGGSEFKPNSVGVQTQLFRKFEHLLHEISFSLVHFRQSIDFDYSFLKAKVNSLSSTTQTQFDISVYHPGTSEIAYRYRDISLLVNEIKRAIIRCKAHIDNIKHQYDIE
jgi:hypothetical protein